MRGAAGMLAALALSVGAGACSTGSTSGPVTLPLGTYDVSAPVCASTGKPPAYPSGSYKLELFDFDNLKTHTLVVTAFQAIETYTDASCTLVATRGLFQNSDGQYAAQRGGDFAFTPAGCALTLAAAGVTYKAGTAYSSAFDPNDDSGPGIPYVANPVAGGYQLVSADSSDLDGVWASYGCAKSDRLEVGLTSVP